MIRKLSLLSFVLLAFSTSALSAVSVEEMRDARNRILERLPQTENLWNRGLTGENNEGYVTVRSSLRSDQVSLIQSENRDRLILYTYVGEKTGTSHLRVGRERAIEIAKKAKDGLWVQEPNGDWIRK